MEAINDKKKQRVSIRDAKEIMEYIWDLENTISNSSEDMKDGVYIQLMDILMAMSCGEFYIELDELARKPTPKARKSRIRPENMRKYVRDNPEKACLCPRCDTPLMKKSLAAHLKSGKCKDTAYLVEGAGGCIKCPEELNNKVINHYDIQTPLVEVELSSENYFWTMFDSPY
jgi:hypothetical protein